MLGPTLSSVVGLTAGGLCIQCKTYMPILFIVLIVLAIVLSALGTIQANIKLLGAGVILLEIALCFNNFVKL